MKNKYAILIVRVSTIVQDYNAQIEDLKKYAKNEGYNKFKIIETKESGLADLKNRQGLTELFEFIKSNKNYDTIIMTELSRLARRQSVLLSIKDKLIDEKIQLIVKDTAFKLFDDDERTELSTYSEIMFTWYSLFSENEIKTKKDRFKRKRKELMQNGNSFYGGKVLFGYHLIQQNGKNVLAVDNESASTIRMIFDWYLHGIDNTNKNPSIQRISRQCVQMGLHEYTHSKRNLTKLLHEGGYTGHKTTNNKYVNPLFGLKESVEKYVTVRSDISYPVILSEEIFNQVQQKIKLKTSQKKTKHETILSGLIECVSCGRKLSANYRYKTNAHSYRCTSRSDTLNCSSSTKSISMVMLDSLIWELIKLDQNALVSKIKELDPNERLVQISKEIDYNKNQISIKEKEVESINLILSNINLKNIDITQMINNYSKKLKTLDSQIGKLRKELLKLDSEKINIEKENLGNKNIISEKIENIELSKTSIRNYINHFVKNIKICYNDNKFSAIELEFKFFSREGILNRNYIPELDILERIVTVFIDKSNTNKIIYLKRTAFYENINLGLIKLVLNKYSESKIVLKKLNQLYLNHS